MSCRLVFSLLAGLVFALTLAFGGCGSDEDASGNNAANGGSVENVEASGESLPEQSRPASGGSPRFKAILVGLKRAQASGSTYGAEKRAKSLPAAEKVVVDAFCYMAWQIGANREAAKLEKGKYIVGRVTTAAEFNLDAPSKIEAAMGGLQQTIDLESLDADEVARYSRACRH
jgi:hypothetical protein